MSLFRLALAASMLLFVAPMVLDTAARAENSVGLAKLRVVDPSRPLGGLVWYPAEPGGTATLVGDNQLFVGTYALRDAKLADGVFPLVLLSHGLGGNDLNQNWLAATLAARGMIVVAVNHPGSTTGDFTPRAAMELWNRPADISRTITWLLADPVFGKHVDLRRISAIGHSQGGDTALALAGVRVDRDRMAAYCDHHDDEGCTDIRKADIRSLPEDRFDGFNRDARVGAVVAMAPGLTPAMTHESLAAVAVPVMVIAGALDRNIPVAHVRRMAVQLPPDAVILEIPGAGHFDFLPPCKPGGALLLREDGDDPVCDSQGSRADFHATVADRIWRFLEAAEMAGKVTPISR